jgi:hypothetical protein
MNNISQEYEQKDLENYIQSVLHGIKKGVDKVEDTKFEIDGSIEFELAVIKNKKGEGKFEIFIAEMGGKYSKEEISRIRFKIKEHKDAVLGVAYDWKPGNELKGNKG